MAARVVCITGASSGIGKATAEWFARKGWAIVCGARRLSLLEEQAETLKSEGAADVLPLALDTRSLASIKRFQAAILQRFPDGAEVLINNAGLALRKDLVAEAQDEDWQTMLDTNVLGVLRMSRELLGPMLARGRGHIVMIGSTASHQVYEGGAGYGATKFAVKAIRETLKLELNGTGVRISSVDPGMVETEFSLVRFGQNQAQADAVYKGMRPLDAADVAGCIGFIVMQPPHVNIDEIIVTPTDQASVTKIHRRL